VLEIDGAMLSGSGTLVRQSVAYAAASGTGIRLFSARARRPKPGLRAQHVAAVRACAELCGATVRGVEVGSPEFTFLPGPSITAGQFRWEIGTAGSTTMLAMCVLPLACLAPAPIRAHLVGGVFQDFAPSPYHTAHVLLPALQPMGVRARLRLVRAGYVPAGSGVLELDVEPVRGRLEPLVLTDPGRLDNLRGVAFCSHLRQRQVSDRMARACEEKLLRRRVPLAIERVYDEEAERPGAALAVWGQTSTGCLLGADRAGAPRRTSEAIGRFVSRALMEDLSAGATVDRHLADQVIIFAALARGTSRFIVPRLTEHVEANLWLAERFGAGVERDGNRIAVEGLGLTRGIPVP
jgi:RNA 3'-terminal phosphate cyclase (ATP)